MLVVPLRALRLVKKSMASAVLWKRLKSNSSLAVVEKVMRASRTASWWTFMGATMRRNEVDLFLESIVERGGRVEDEDEVERFVGSGNAGGDGFADFDALEVSEHVVDAVEVGVGDDLVAGEGDVDEGGEGDVLPGPVGPDVEDADGEHVAESPGHLLVLGPVVRPSVAQEGRRSWGLRCRACRTRDPVPAWRTQGRPRSW